MKKLICVMVAAVIAGVMSAYAEKGCWARVRFQKLNGGSGLQLSELALYDSEGARVNSSLGVVADGTAAENLAVNKATGYAKNGMSQRSFADSYEGLQNLFDNSTGSKMYRTLITSPAEGEANSNTWAVITMRLGEKSKPTSYNFATANDSMGSRSPTAWIVELSTNGLDWAVADSRTGVAWPTTTYTWWNGGEKYPLVFDWDAFRVNWTQTEVVYAGENTVKPAPVVVCAADPTVTLVEGTDYTVEYTDWNVLGTATATVTGIGAYAGSENVHRYTVIPGFEAQLLRTLVTNDFVHPYLPGVEVRRHGTETLLEENVHYRLEYHVAGTGFGSATVDVIGLGAYLGSFETLAFTIVTDRTRLPARYWITNASLAAPETSLCRSSVRTLYDGNYGGTVDIFGSYAAMLDFGTPRDIDVIAVSPRSGNGAECAGRSRNFRIRGSNDLRNWTLVHTNNALLTESRLNFYRPNVVQSSRFRYIALDNVQQLNVSEVAVFANEMTVDSSADPNPFANNGTESEDAAEGVLIKGKLTCSPEGPAAVSVFIAERDLGDDYARWNREGRRFDVGEFAAGATFETRLADIGEGVWHWRIFASRGDVHSASPVQVPFLVGSKVILPKAYVKNANMGKLYDASTAYWGDTTTDIWIIFDLEGIDLVRNRLAGWRMWPRSGFIGRLVDGCCDFGYEPEGGADWGETTWSTNGTKRVIGRVSGVPSNIEWRSDLTDIGMSSVTIAPSVCNVPYRRSPLEKPPRYIRFRGFQNANCSEIELRVVRFRRGALLRLK